MFTVYSTKNLTYNVHSILYEKSNLQCSQYIVQKSIYNPFIYTNYKLQITTLVLFVIKLYLTEYHYTNKI